MADRHISGRHKHDPPNSPAFGDSQWDFVRAAKSPTSIRSCTGKEQASLMRRKVFSVERIEDFLSETVRPILQIELINAFLGVESAGFDTDL